MPSKLGRFLKERRVALDLGVRELARLIEKSPALLTRLENEDNPPSIGPETLRALARALRIEPDELLVLAERTEEMAPRTVLEVALYRKVQGLSKRKQEALLKQLDKPQE
jgi:transcriptional regulator with XRE-family HTH domain